MDRQIVDGAPQPAWRMKESAQVVSKLDARAGGERVRLAADHASGFLIRL